MAVVSAWAEQVGGAGAGPARSAPRRGSSVVGDGGGGGQRLGQDAWLLVGGQVRGQRGQRLGAGGVVGDGGGGGQRLGQHGGLVGGQVRGQPGQRLGAGVVAGDGGGGGQRLGQQALVGGQVRGQAGQRLGAGVVAVMAVAVASAWASRSGGRCGASPVSARARA